MSARRLTLVVRPDGRAILCAKDNLSDVELSVLVDAFRGWEEGQTLILSGVDVVSVTEVTLDIVAPALEEVS